MKEILDGQTIEVRTEPGGGEIRVPRLPRVAWEAPITAQEGEQFMVRGALTDFDGEARHDTLPAAKLELDYTLLVDAPVTDGIFAVPISIPTAGTHVARLLGVIAENAATKIFVQADAL